MKLGIINTAQHSTDTLSVTNTDRINSESKSIFLLDYVKSEQCLLLNGKFPQKISLHRVNGVNNKMCIFRFQQKQRLRNFTSTS